MGRDARLYTSNPRTRRRNVVNLPTSGAFGRRKLIDRAYFSGKFWCQCAKEEDNYKPPLGCFMITNPILPNVCDLEVFPPSGKEFDEIIALGLPEPPAPYDNAFTK